MNPFTHPTRRAALLGLGAAGLAGAASAAPPEHPLWPRHGPPVLRGATIAQRRRRDSLDGPPGAFAGPEKAVPAYGAADFDALAEAGANLVVMSLPELWTVTPPYRRDAAMVDLLGRQLDLARKAGLYAVVGLRSGPGRSDFIFHRESAGTWFPKDMMVDDIWRNREAQAAWIEMCADAAKLIAGRAETAGLLLMVEPDPNVSGVDAKGMVLDVYEPRKFWSRVSEASDWRRIAADAARKVRAVSQDLPVLISPPGFARADYAAGMGGLPVEGCVWCVHDYEPWVLTHLERDRKAPRGPVALGSFAARAADLSKSAPVFLGEFGAARWSPKAADIVRARIATCEAGGMNWSVFRWPTLDDDYEKLDDMFNVAWGSDPALKPGPGALLPTLKTAWERNSRRPGLGLRGRN
jgi:hypothetical protein